MMTILMDVGMDGNSMLWALVDTANGSLSAAIIDSNLTVRSVRGSGGLVYELGTLLLSKSSWHQSFSL